MLQEEDKTDGKEEKSHSPSKPLPAVLNCNKESSKD